MKIHISYSKPEELEAVTVTDDLKRKYPGAVLRKRAEDSGLSHVWVTVKGEKSTQNTKEMS